MKKHYKAEEVVAILHEAEVSPESATDFCQRKAISGKTFYRWRKQFGGLQVDEAKRLKTVEGETTRLKKLLAEAMLANEGLKDLLSKK